MLRRVLVGVAGLEGRVVVGGKVRQDMEQTLAGLCRGERRPGAGRRDARLACGRDGGQMRK